MYGLNRCPRCGGHRLIRRSASDTFLICAGCGLASTEPGFPPPHTATTGFETVLLRRQMWTLELPVCRSPLMPMKHP
jgi:ribosomal protein L37AE/L43A